MRIRWTLEALGDVERLGDFIARHDPAAADKLEAELVAAPNALLAFPRRGRPLTEFRPREVREFAVGRYLLRYEMAGDQLFVLRFFHGRENR